MLRLLFSALTMFSLFASTPALAKAPKQKQTLSFAVVGDIMMHRYQLSTAWNRSCRCYRFHRMFGKSKKALSTADLTIGNLETTLPGPKVGYSGFPHFASPDSLADTLKRVGFDVLFTSNNHSADKGKVGVVRTLKVLDRLGLKHVGTYASPQEHQRNRFLLVRRKGFKIAFLNYTESTNDIAIPKGTVINMIRMKQVKADIALARKQKPDLIIVGYHFGQEYQRQPNKQQRKIVRATFKYGADVVLGSHPHVLQPFKAITLKDRFGVTKPRLVIYSLGNFISYQRGRHSRGGIIFRFRLERWKHKGRIVRTIRHVRYTPVYVHIGRYPSRKIRKGRRWVRKRGRRYFRVIPIPPYLKNDQKMRLARWSYRQMKMFSRDVVTFYRKNLRDTRRILTRFARKVSR